MKEIEELVRMSTERNSSDLHLIWGLPPKIRVDGQMENLTEDILYQDELIDLVKELCGERYKEIENIGEIDLSDNIAGSRCRVHIYKQQGVPSVALRILHDEIPDIQTIGLPEAALKLTSYHKGIILVTGETGSGKSTTLAAMMQDINLHRKAHIVTLEDPIEYVYKPELCAINQREIGKDTRSFSDGLRAALREDPDVILIGEMRDRDTIETAITAAETGHLVFGTLHTASASDSVDRIVQVYPPDAQNQIRLQLSMVLQAVISQQLLRKKMGGRVLACEFMLVTDAIRNMIRDGNTPQIHNAIATSASIGGQTMDQALIQLARKGLITKETAMAYAKDSLYVNKNCR